MYIRFCTVTTLIVFIFVSNISAQTTGRFNCEYANEITKAWTTDDWKRNAAEWTNEHWIQYFDCLNSKYSTIKTKAEVLKSQYFSDIARLEEENKEFTETGKMVKDPDIKKQVEQVIKFNSDSIEIYKNKLQRIDEVKKTAEYEILSTEICQSHQKLAEQLVAINNKIYEDSTFLMNEDNWDKLSSFFETSEQIIDFYQKVKDSYDNYIDNNDEILKSVQKIDKLNDEILLLNKIDNELDDAEDIVDFLQEQAKINKIKADELFEIRNRKQTSKLSSKDAKTQIGKAKKVKRIKKAKEYFNILKNVFSKSTIIGLLITIADEITDTSDYIIDSILRE